MVNPPARVGPRPRTSEVIPHIQLDQWPDSEIYRKLLDSLLLLPHVGHRQSRMARPDTVALVLDEAVALGPGEAFIDDHEFCHIHALPNGTIHLPLPDAIRQRVLELGWGQLHVAARNGFVAPTLCLIYAPRNLNELGIISGIVQVGMRFAGGDINHNSMFGEGLRLCPS